MGTSLSSIHIYSDHPVEGYDNFYSFSDGWQTYMPDEDPENPYNHRKLAKQMSKKTDDPVLWFYIFDSEYITFDFYKNGKMVSSYSQTGIHNNKNLYGIPSMVGYENGEKRRLSKILSCADIDYQLDMLEEYFGVCLVPDKEIFEDDINLLRRARSDELYHKFVEEEKAITGKKAPIRAELVYERKGKIFDKKFAEKTHFHKPHHFYFGYETFESNFDDGDLRPVRFDRNELKFITQEEFDSAQSVPFAVGNNDDRYEVEYYPLYKIHFTQNAPEMMRNKTVTIPKGYYFSWFDEKGRAILSNERGGLMFMDGTLKVIAKINVKGDPVDYMDGYLLTAGDQSFFAYTHNPTDAVRIYHIVEND